MSVRLSVESDTLQDGRITIPVAPQLGFTGDWLVVASKLELEWVPLFETGISISTENVGFIIDELEKMRDFLSANSLIGIMPSVSQHIITTIERMIPILMVFYEDSDATGWVG
ncbi:MAG: hypothetical protein BroJett018_24130 [Chloroflexota bacterium]|nr:MAG: hypothetical protein BroJett018_24130 [Chloroflexota bacterium]